MGASAGATFSTAGRAPTAVRPMAPASQAPARATLDQPGSAQCIIGVALGSMPVSARPPMFAAPPTLVQHVAPLAAAATARAANVSAGREGELEFRFSLLPWADNRLHTRSRTVLRLDVSSGTHT